MISIALMLKYGAIITLLFAAISDSRRLRIPNVYPATMIALFLVALMTGFGFDAPAWQHALHFAIALAVGMALFHFDIVGGGDAKLYASTALWFGFSDGLRLFVLTTVTGGAIVMLRMAYNLLKIAFGAASRDSASIFKRKIAYGIAIAAGGIATILITYPEQTPRDPHWLTAEHSEALVK